MEAAGGGPALGTSEPRDSEAGRPGPGLAGSQQSQLLTLRSSSRSRAELLVSPGPLAGMAGSWAAGGRLGLHGAGRLRGRDGPSLAQRELKLRHRSGGRGGGKQSGAPPRPQAAAGFGNSAGSTCGGEKRGQWGRAPPSSSSRRGPGPRRWPSRSLPARLTSSSGGGPCREPARRHGHGAACLPAPARCPRRGGTVGLTSGTSSCLPPPPCSPFTTVLCSERFPHPSRPSRPLGNPTGPQPGYIFLLLLGPPGSHPHSAPTPRGGSEPQSQDVAR